MQDPKRSPSAFFATPNTTVMHNPPQPPVQHICDNATGWVPCSLSYSCLSSVV
ncbi:hypothetical protein M405DRAFT_813719 [Rhizopogon salebrosus TDB-379]|nr:hypothetical protein M405DRAFT_813719 [Rhizopogon salebrosus TDB-379]